MYKSSYNPTPPIFTISKVRSTTYYGDILSAYRSKAYAHL